MLRRLQSLLLNAAVAVALLAGAVAVAAETGLIVTERPPGSTPSVLERPTPKIKVKGKVKGLYPGAVKQMKVRVRNDTSRQVRLVSIRARVKDAGPGCARQNISVKRFKGRKRIRSHTSTRVRVKVTMATTAPDACQGARFPIKFRAKVTRRR